MAVNMQGFRTNFLDISTNVAVQYFKTITDTAVYNSVNTNLAITDSLTKVKESFTPLEGLVKDSLNTVKGVLGATDFSNTLKPIINSFDNLLPVNLTNALNNFSNNGLSGMLNGAFNKISNLGASSLCDLINLALGIDLLSLMLNLSPDMMKRLAMLALLALLSKLCNRNLNSFSNPSNLININDIKTIGRNTAKSLYDNSNIGSAFNRIENTLHKISNPVNTIMNPSNTHNVFNNVSPLLNPGLATMPKSWSI